MNTTSARNNKQPLASHASTPPQLCIRHAAAAATLGDRLQQLRLAAKGKASQGEAQNVTVWVVAGRRMGFDDAAGGEGREGSEGRAREEGAAV